MTIRAFVIMERGPDGLRGFDRVHSGPGMAATLNLDFTVHKDRKTVDATLARLKRNYPGLFDAFEVVPVKVTVEESNG